MTFSRQLAFAAALMTLGPLANATVTTDFGSFTLSYDETTVLGAPVGFTGAGGAVGFHWTLPDTVGLSVSGAANALSYDLPSFTITANSGWALSGPLSGFVGNLSFSESAGANTSAAITADLSVDGSPAIPSGGALARFVSPLSIPGVVTGGYYQNAGVFPVGNFSTFSFSNGSLALLGSAPLGGFATLLAQPQNEYKVTLTATAVPEPQSYALLAAGLLALGALARRRSSHGTQG